MHDGAVDGTGPPSQITYSASPTGMMKNEIRVGDEVGFQSKSNRNVHGRVLRLNPKTVTLSVEPNEQWRVPYSMLLAQGLSEFEVMRLAGHVKFETTRQFYLAVRSDTIDRARMVLEASRKGNSVAHPL